MTVYVNWEEQTVLNSKQYEEYVAELEREYGSRSDAEAQAFDEYRGYDV